jgi:DNA repair exonuclease SbcCD ATPase subunit
LDLEARNKETLSTLAEKEMQLEESNKRIQELLDKLDHHQDNDSALHFTEKEEGQEQEIKKTDNDHQQQQQQQMEADKEKEDMYQQLEEKDRMLHDMQMKLEELQIQWEAERAELVKPALEQVNAQLEELKETVSTYLFLYRNC